ncbi:MAG: hypothetical protein BRD55_04270 [Bacteroidetes bacterium SW_9_63_38]|nr:MAG: hypothetical protein BRD55_04270 [Bacteroidetes bacterium SW_9_63_38]
MSEMQVPATDAFDHTDEFDSLQVELTPEQIEWLEQTASDRGLSVGHLLRSIITAQMRGVDETPSLPEESGGGASRSPSVDVSDKGPRSTDDPEDEASDRSDAPNIVESLRSASERLQDLTEKEEENQTENSGLHDTLERLQAHMDLPSGDDQPDAEEEDAKTPSRTMLQNQNPSMFDMMDDE